MSKVNEIAMARYNQLCTQVGNAYILRETHHKLAREQHEQVERHDTALTDLVSQVSALDLATLIAKQMEIQVVEVQEGSPRTPDIRVKDGTGGGTD